MVIVQFGNKFLLNRCFTRGHSSYKAIFTFKSGLNFFNLHMTNTTREISTPDCIFFILDSTGEITTHNCILLFILDRRDKLGEITTHNCIFFFHFGQGALTTDLFFLILDRGDNYSDCIFFNFRQGR